VVDLAADPSQNGVLGDHSRIGKRYVPPFLHQVGPITEVSWVDEIIPELVWIGLLLKHSGDRRGTDLAAHLTKAASAQEVSVKGGCFVWLSDFEGLPRDWWHALTTHLSAEHALDEIRSALSSLLSSYPDCPLGGLQAAGAAPSPVGIGPIAETLMGLYARKSEFATKVQATAVYLALVSGVLKLVGNEVLADFHEVAQYPRTEASRKVAASIRSTLTCLHGLRDASRSGSWPLRFWNRGLALDPCQGVFSSDPKERDAREA
jgi:hypothetical protein